MNKLIGLIFLFALTSNCSNQDKLKQVSETVQCPVDSHTDSIIPIIYGEPSEEMFVKEDSGLIKLGGCVLYDSMEVWWCKIHKISF